MSIKKNFIYLSIYKIIEMLLPLITSPLLSRRLGADGLGIYSYTYSITSVFITFSELGLYRYGMREIAKVRDDKNRLNQTYSDIFTVHILNAGVIFLLYCAYVLFLSKDNYRFYFLCQGILILNNLIDNAFLFVGIENIKALSIRDGITKIIAFFLIVLFVRNPGDTALYILVMALSSTISKAFSLYYARKVVKLVRPNMDNCRKHYFPMIRLMIPALAGTIYQSMDKIMIGNIYSETEVGYYECASKALISRNVITALGTVLCPRIANLYASGQIEEAVKKVEYSYKISMIISIAFMFGIIGIANEFAPWFWGDTFSICSPMMIGLALSIPIWTIGEVIRNQFLLPVGRDNEYMKSFLIGVLSNACINFILIPVYGAIGAIIATLIAEIIMSVLQILSVRNEIRNLEILKGCIPYFFDGLIMLVCVRFVAYIISTPIYLTLVVEIVVGVVTYILLALIIEHFTNDHCITDLIVKFFLKKIKRSSK